jgi:hypothetical protein
MIDKEVVLANQVYSAMSVFDFAEDDTRGELKTILLSVLSCFICNPPLWKCYKEFLEVLEPSLWFSNSRKTQSQNIEKIGDLYKLYLSLSGIEIHPFTPEDWFGFALWAVILKRGPQISHEIAKTMDEIAEYPRHEEQSRLLKN